MLYEVVISASDGPKNRVFPLCSSSTPRLALITTTKKWCGNQNPRCARKKHIFPSVYTPNLVLISKFPQYHNNRAPRKEHFTVHDGVHHARGTTALQYTKLDCSITTNRVPTPNDTYVFGSSRRHVSNFASLNTPTLLQTWTYRPWKITPVSYTHLTLPTILLV